MNNFYNFSSLIATQNLHRLVKIFQPQGNRYKLWYVCYLKYYEVINN